MLQDRLATKERNGCDAAFGGHRSTVAAGKQVKSDDVTAVHVSVDEEDTRKVQEKWAIYGGDVPLVIIESPYRELLHPLISYIEEAADNCSNNEITTVVVPQFVPTVFWHNFLHMQTASWLRWALLHMDHVLVVDIPYQVE